MSTAVDSMQAQAEEFRDRYQAVHEMIGRVIVGHEDIVHGVLTAVLCGGHVLLEGVPGLGKTMLVRTLAEVMELQFNRIQFTPDLMPADILGTNMIVEDADGRRSFEFQRGPVFTQILLADEINRATPKTQSAMLETMQEGTVTAAGTRFQLDQPFFVLATQNPIEQEGTYPLPEAQLDRFLFKLVVGYSGREDLNTIVERTTRGEKVKLDKVMDGSEILKWQGLVREVILARHVQDYLVRLTLATHPDGPHAVDATNNYVRWGSSPRGAQTLALAAKVRALLEGRYNVSFEDARRVFLPAMRHRVLLNFEAQAEGIDPDQVLLDILEKVPEKGGLMPDVNPYRPAAEIADAGDIRRNDDGGWIFRRLAGASSAIGTLLVAISVLRFISGDLLDPSLMLAAGCALIASGYYWYGRDVRPAVVWSLFSFCIVVALGLLAGWLGPVARSPWLAKRSRHSPSDVARPRGRPVSWI